MSKKIACSMARWFATSSALEIGGPDSREEATAFVSNGFGAEPRTTLAVIAGGAGRRMGGPKHALRIHGAPILGLLLDRLCWQGPTMLVVQAVGERVNGQERVDQVVADGVSGQGPLRGILRAMECSGTETLIAVPIDMPGLNAAHLLWVLEQGLKTSNERLLLRRVVGGRSVVEPFPAFFRLGGAGQIRQLLDGGRRALRELADLPGTRVIDVPHSWDEQTWMNLNTPVDAACVGAELHTGVV